MRFDKRFDWALKTWWDHAWKKGNVRFNIRSSGFEDVRSVLYLNGQEWNELKMVCDNQLWMDIEDEDERFCSIRDYVNRRVTYVTDPIQYGKNEFWQSAYETWKRKKGDCDDVAILIKMLTLIAEIPDYRVKCCCLNINDLAGNFIGGHFNILYLWRKNNVWTIEEGTWKKGGYGRIWFTFNREFSWAQHDMKFDRASIRKSVRP